MMAAQARMKPLYFHYQVDCERDSDEAAQTAPGSDRVDSQRDPSPQSTPDSQSGTCAVAGRLNAVDPQKLYKYANELPQDAANNEEQAASTTSKGKKKKNMKEAVITQFNPSAAVYQPPNAINPHNINGYDLASLPGPLPGIASPFQQYPGSVLPMALPVSTNQQLIVAPSLHTLTASPAMNASALLSTNPTAHPDSAMYLNFTPSPRTLLNLLPVDDHEVIGPPVSGGHRKSQHDHGDHDDHKDLEED